MKWLVCVVLLSGCQLVFDVDAPTGDEQCPAVFAGARYLHVDMLLEWMPAEDHCLDLDDKPDDAKHVHLAVLNSPTEFRDLQLPIDAEAYIGLTDRKQSGGTIGPRAEEFLWITDEPGLDTSQASISPWAGGEPDSGSAPPYCGVLRDDGTLKASGCDRTAHTFVCECDDFAENPALIFPGL